MYKTIVTGTCVGLVFALAATARAEVKYVAADGTGTCTGGWANACTLTDALNTPGAGHELWLKAGTYSATPYDLDSADDGIIIIGGFAGTESSADQSDPMVNETILNAGGSGRVLSVTGTSASTLIRGLTITGGYVPGYEEGGGGLLVMYGSALFVSCTFRDNHAEFYGGGVAIHGSISAPRFISCVFHDHGLDDGSSDLGNGDSPGGGGAVFVRRGSPEFTNCLFYNNIAQLGGAVLEFLGTSTYINCTFVKNRATYGSGGALFDEHGDAIVRNSIIWDNSAYYRGSQIYNDRYSLTEVTYSTVMWWYPGTGNLFADPDFIDPDNDNYAISILSPCLDTGNTADLSADYALYGGLDWDVATTGAMPLDLGGNSREDCTAVDMGAYEHQVDLGADCNTNGVPDTCEPDEDCNGNMVQDICDIAVGTSEDCNDNGILDECDMDRCVDGAPWCSDCNENDVPDACDVLGPLRACCLAGDCLVRTACWCSAEGGAWLADKKWCIGVNCGAY